METLHPRVQVLWIVQALVTATVLMAVAAVANLFLRVAPTLALAGVWVVLAVLGGVHAIARYRRWAFDIEDDALYLRRGVVTQVDTAVPFVRVQHADTQRGPLERAVGLSSVVVYTAGSRGADITIPGLQPARATELRERLRDLAVESGATDAV